MSEIFIKNDLPSLVKLAKKQLEEEMIEEEKKSLDEAIKQKPNIPFYVDRYDKIERESLEEWWNEELKTSMRFDKDDLECMARRDAIKDLVKIVIKKFKDSIKERLGDLEDEKDEIIGQHEEGIEQHSRDCIFEQCGHMINIEIINAKQEELREKWLK